MTARKSPPRFSKSKPKTGLPSLQASFWDSVDAEEADLAMEDEELFRSAVSLSRFGSRSMLALPPPPPPLPIVPMHLAARSAVVYPQMASERFMAGSAERFIEDTWDSLERAAPEMWPDAGDFGVPGYVMATSSKWKSTIIVYELQHGRPIGGMARGTVVVDPAHRGKSLGSEILIKAFETGIKRPNDGSFFSPHEYANRSAAHRRAVEKAIAKGDYVPSGVLESYPDIVARQGFSLQDMAAMEEAGLFPKAHGGSMKGNPSNWNGTPDQGVVAAHPRLPSLDKLREKAIDSASGTAFADGITARLWPAVAVVDSLGQHVTTGSLVAVQAYTKLREYSLIIPPAHHRVASLHRRLEALWEKWERQQVRGFFPAREVARDKTSTILRIVEATGAEYVMSRKAPDGLSEVAILPRKFNKPFFVGMQVAKEDPVPHIAVTRIQPGDLPAAHIETVLQELSDLAVKRELEFRLQVPGYHLPPLPQPGAPAL